MFIPSISTQKSINNNFNESNFKTQHTFTTNDTYKNNNKIEDKQKDKIKIIYSAIKAKFDMSLNDFISQENDKQKICIKVICKTFSGCVA